MRKEADHLNDLATHVALPPFEQHPAVERRDQVSQGGIAECQPAVLLVSATENDIGCNDCVEHFRLRRSTPGLVEGGRATRRLPSLRSRGL